MNLFGRKEKAVFLQLHCPEPIYIAVKDIAVMRWYEKELVTRICTNAGRCWVVQETPEEILEMIAEVSK